MFKKIHTAKLADAANSRKRRRDGTPPRESASSSRRQDRRSSEPRHTNRSPHSPTFSPSSPGVALSSIIEMPPKQEQQDATLPPDEEAMVHQACKQLGASQKTTIKTISAIARGSFNINFFVDTLTKERERERLPKLISSYQAAKIQSFTKLSQEMARARRHKQSRR